MQKLIKEKKINEKEKTKRGWEEKMENHWEEEGNGQAPNIDEIESFIRRNSENVKKFGNKLVFVSKDNWPVESIIGHPIITFIRRLILTKKIVRYSTWIEKGGCVIDFNSKKK